MRCDVLIIGAGPAGLRCAGKLAKKGVQVILLERQNSIGKKVCAGGITWGGMISRIPETLIERFFEKQTISTRLQSVSVASPHPMIATINRENLGRFMTEQALQSGAQILTGARVERIDKGEIVFTRDNKKDSVFYDFLVGADGSNSIIRSHLGLQTVSMGLGIQYIIPESLPEMIWNFDTRKFGSGYSWVFPHRKYGSVGAFTGSRFMSARKLKLNLDKWLLNSGLSVATRKVQAANVNCDFRGWRYGRTFLLGDAAGLASPLTGEGIYPAIISAETVANVIVDKNFVPSQLETMIKKHRSHQIMQRFATKSPMIGLILSEMSAFMLKYRIIALDKFEMGCPVHEHE